MHLMGYYSTSAPCEAGNRSWPCLLPLQPIRSISADESERQASFHLRRMRFHRYGDSASCQRATNSEEDRIWSVHKTYGWPRLSSLVMADTSVAKRQ